MAVLRRIDPAPCPPPLFRLQHLQRVENVTLGKAGQPCTEGAVTERDKPRNTSKGVGIGLLHHVVSGKQGTPFCWNLGCDISTDNSRVFPGSILFAPLIRLERYVQRLRSAGKGEAHVESLLDSIRSQLVTTIFYLPTRENVLDESIILLDDIHAHPLPDFVRSERSHVFTLSQTAFYIFLMKVSIHFCRFNEGIARESLGHLPA